MKGGGAMRLRLQDVSCVRGARRLFAGVSATLHGGDAATLVGPNGAGKSTLLRALAGLAPIETGEVRYDAHSLRTDRDAVQEMLLYLGHLDGVKPAMTALENLVFWARYLGGEIGAEERARAGLERFGLSEKADAPAGQCSAGQKRRLGLARLAVADRPVWLLDEPTVSLDAANVAVLTELVKAHCAAGGVALIATHTPLDLDLAAVIDLGGYRPEQGGGANAAAADPFLDGDDWTGAGAEAAGRAAPARREARR